MLRWSHVFRLGVKELHSFVHDYVLVLVVLYAFTFSIYFAATGISHELHNAAIAIVDEDQSHLSKRIADSFYGPYFKPAAQITREEIDPGMDSARYTFVIDIPPDFERDVLAGRRPVVQVNIDATAVSQAGIGAGYIRNIILGEVNEFVRGRRIEVEWPVQLIPRIQFNPSLTTSWFTSVMQIISVVTMISILLSGAALIREREHGTIGHLLVMPVRPVEIMLAKVWANGLVVLGAVSLSLVLVVRVGLGVPIAGSVWLLLVGTGLFLFASTSMGIVLATIARTMPQFGMLTILVVLILNMLSGGTTPREGMPYPLQTAMLLAPTTHYVDFAQAILYRGAGLRLVWPHFLAVAVGGVILFMIALARFRRTLVA